MLLAHDIASAWFLRFPILVAALFLRFPFMESREQPNFWWHLVAFLPLNLLALFMRFTDQKRNKKRQTFDYECIVRRPASSVHPHRSFLRCDEPTKSQCSQQSLLFVGPFGRLSVILGMN